MTKNSAAVGSRPVLWDVVLASGLVFLAGVVGAILLALGSVAVRELLRPLADGLGSVAQVVVSVPVCIAAGAVASRLLRRWPSAAARSFGWLTASGILGCMVAWFAVIALEPWHDLLEDEVAHSGPSAFYLEWAKTFVPWLAGTLVTFVSLRYESLRRTRPAWEWGRRTSASS